LFLYRLVLTALSPLAVLWLGWRRLSGRETNASIRERLGGHGGPGPSIWIHGASLGELTAARQMIAALRSRWPAMSLVVTTNTATGRALVEGWQDPLISARMAPLDYHFTLARFLRNWKPVALISLENELWPNRTTVCATRSIPVLLVAARISESSAGLWRRWPGLAQSVMPLLAWVAPQDLASEERFRSLGVADRHLADEINLKSGVALLPPDPKALAAQIAVMPRADTLLAASTHPGEEALILEAYRLARRKWPALRLILAPRHPARGPAIADQVRAAGFRLAQRSAAQGADARTEVLLADTLGEMPLWYSAAGITFVGGSLVDHGGHTPYEPAQFDSAIVHGPYVANHAIYAALDAERGAITAKDAPGLADAILAMGRRQAETTRTARRVLQAEAGSITTLAPLLEALTSMTGLTDPSPR